MDSPDLVRARFQQRSRLLDDQCKLDRNQKAVATHTIKADLRKIAYGRLNFCAIAKIGSTFTRIIQQRHFSDRSHKKVKAPLKSYMFVREPYSRLMSGYIGKIVTNPLWWSSFGTLLISKFRPGASKNEKSCGIGATFPEFVKYLIFSQETGKYIDQHFQPIHQQCGLCHRHYDFIGHLENLPGDMRFILSSVNITGKDLSLEDSESTIRDKTKNTVRHRAKIKKCQDMCSIMTTVWWSFHARGLISRDIKLPVNGSRCDTISEDEFFQIAMGAHNASIGHIDRGKQKRGALVELFTQVPLQDRLRLKELFMADFELFGYDPMPPDLFPEMYLNRAP